MPREGLKPGAVVEEGGKRRAGATSLERAGGARSQGWLAGPHRDPQAPPVPALSWQSGPGCIPWQPLGEGLHSQALGARFILQPRLAPAGLESIPPLPPSADFCAEAPSCGFPIPSAPWPWGPGCALQSCPLA